MKWNIFFMIFLCIILSISSCKAIGQELDLGTLIAGIKHYDSLVKSGTGTVVYEHPLRFFDKSKDRTEKMVCTLTFEGKTKIRANFLESSRHRNNTTYIWDGEKTIIYTPDEKRYVRVDGRDFALERYIDPRFWMTARGRVYEYLNNPTGEYLEKNIKNVEILRTEKVNDIFCYVLKEHNVTIWIAPKMGFRMIKRDCPTYLSRGPGHVEFKRRIYYKEYKRKDITFWFPKRVEQEINKITPEGKFIKNDSKSKLYVKDDFKLNVDVSDKLKLNIPPDTMIYDYPSKTYIPAREIFK